MWVDGELTKNRGRVEQAAYFPLRPLPHIEHHSTGLPCPGGYLRLLPLLVIGGQRQRNMAQMKEQTEAPEKIQLSNEETANLSDAQFKTLVIRMLTETVEYCRKIEGEVKAMQNEMK